MPMAISIQEYPDFGIYCGIGILQRAHSTNMACLSLELARALHVIDLVPVLSDRGFVRICQMSSMERFCA